MYAILLVTNYKDIYCRIHETLVICRKMSAKMSMWLGWTND